MRGGGGGGGGGDDGGDDGGSDGGVGGDGGGGCNRRNRMTIFGRSLPNFWGFLNASKL